MFVNPCCSLPFPEWRKSSLGFSELTVHAVMVPRTELEALPVTATWPEVRHVAANSGHKSFPVYEDDLDHVVGVLHIKDLFAVLDRDGTSDFDLRHVVRPALMVPDSMPVDTLLVRLRDERRRVAIVVDEFGGIAGLVTLQDVLERIVGQFGDEFQAALPEIVPAADGSLLIDGLSLIEDVVRQTDLRVDPGDTDEVETIGGLVMLNLGRLPQVGDEVRLGTMLLRVEQLDGRRVMQVRLLLAPLAPDGDA